MAPYMVLVGVVSALIPGTVRASHGLPFMGSTTDSRIIAMCTLCMLVCMTYTSIFTNFLAVNVCDLARRAQLLASLGVLIDPAALPPHLTYDSMCGIICSRVLSATYLFIHL
jgi:hypothetical protein